MHISYSTLRRKSTFHPPLSYFLCNVFFTPAFFLFPCFMKIDLLEGRDQSAGGTACVHFMIVNATLWLYANALQTS